MIPIATIDDLLDKVESKYTLVHLSARRAREINSYYHSLGEGLGRYTPPLVEQVDSNKPLSIALEEIAAEKIVPSYPGDARRTAEELLGGEEAEDAAEETDKVAEDTAAEVVALASDTGTDDGAASDES
ncbi:MAG: DNA-directed RNA polymerase subunit omega [Nitriliruptorales bacterium]|nr:DNA-directed RNA polymerase subunit omega [Nitriliruptorales bacterium]